MISHTSLFKKPNVCLESLIYYGKFGIENLTKVPTLAPNLIILKYSVIFV